MAKAPKFGSAPVKKEGHFVVYDEVGDWVIPIEDRCYEWLKKAYPQIHKEFIAVDDIEQAVKGYRHG